MDFLAGPTGGLSYHAAALRYRQTLWQPFLGSVENWLSQTWNPKSRDLVIFGPSAGWTLPAGFLARFDSVIGIEPDPIGRTLFRYRFRSAKQNPGIKKLQLLSSENLLPWFSPRPQVFSDFLAQHAESAILFSNLLGQIPLLHPDRALAAMIDKQELFIESLRGREWASYHDLLSGRAQVLPTAPKKLSAQTAIAILTDLVPFSDFAEEIFPAGSQIVDHDTLWLSAPDSGAGRTSTELATWQIRPGVHHLVGFVHFSPFA